MGFWHSFRTKTGVIAVEITEACKLGSVSVTYVSMKATCPTSCPLLDKVCYSQKGRPGMIAQLLNRFRGTGEEVAQHEAEAILGLSGRRDLRIHVGGEFRSARAARRIARAAAEYMARFGRVVWGYTHRWKRIPRSAFGPMAMLASTHSMEEAEWAMERGYAAALEIAPKIAYEISGKRDEETGLMPLVCPAARHPDRVSCTGGPCRKIPKHKGILKKACRMCLKDDWMREAGIVVVFPTH